jgi:thioredoxin-related protein
MIIYPPAAKRRARLSDWAKSLNIGYVPTLVLFDTSGREVFRIDAYVRPFHLAGALEYVSSGAYRSEPSFQRFLQSKTESLLKRGTAVDLWN